MVEFIDDPAEASSQPFTKKPWRAPKMLRAAVSDWTEGAKISNPTDGISKFHALSS